MTYLLPLAKGLGYIVLGMAVACVIVALAVPIALYVVWANLTNP